MIAYAPPTEVGQLQFLKNIQRLLNEGSFVASYKFALLHALADLAIVKGDDSGAPLPLAITDIAEKFIELYWQQARPFNARQAGFVLKQNVGAQAAVVNLLVNAHKESQGSLYQYRKDKSAWNGLVRSVANVVRVMPLWKLQTVGTEQVPFLYDRSDDPQVIKLKPGVAYCFRAFYPMLCNLFRSAWIDYVRRFNTESLGHITDLREFMFGGERVSLVHALPILRTIQNNRCLYCEEKLHGNPDVDHFIPWSRCRSDLAHNLVLAHKGCNAAKSDHLACERHLKKWTDRNKALSSAAHELEKIALPHDIDATGQIARWAYSNTEQTHGQVWIIRKEFTRLDGIWRTLFLELEDAIPRLKNKH
jgi:hypothetical protein